MVHCYGMVEKKIQSCTLLYFSKLDPIADKISCYSPTILDKGIYIQYNYYPPKIVSSWPLDNVETYNCISRHRTPPFNLPPPKKKFYFMTFHKIQDFKGVLFLDFVTPNFIQDCSTSNLEQWSIG